MKKILFLALLYLPIFVQSQNWFPNGATWYYNYQEQFAFPANGYTKYTVIKDTIIISRPAKLIKRETIRYNGNIILDDSLFVREDSSKVYYYKNNSFKLMYDFTLNVGDTLYINLNSSACDSVKPGVPKQGLYR